MNVTIGYLGIGVIGALLAGVSAYLHVKGKDGSGWAFLAFLFLLTSCIGVPDK